MAPRGENDTRRPSNPIYPVPTARNPPQQYNAGMTTSAGSGGIRTHPELCTGCLTCQLICSLTWDGLCKPSSARIIITGNLDDRSIAFSEDCTECDICAEYCPYGALEIEEET